MLPVALCLVALIVLLLAERAHWQSGKAVAKLTASSAFVWAAYAWGATTTLYGQLLLLGLLLSWIGDALLLPAGKARWFQLGILAFLLAHLAYALAFTRLALAPMIVVACGVVAGIAGWSVLRWLRPHLHKSFRWLVVAYVVAILSMVVVAAAAVGSGGPAVVAIGAVGFALSDVAVARNRFVSSGFINTAWGLPVYYLSQLALAYSVTYFSPAV